MFGRLDVVVNIMSYLVLIILRSSFFLNSSNLEKDLDTKYGF